MSAPTLPESYPQVPEAFRYALDQPQRAVPQKPVGPECQVLFKGSGVIGTSFRDCHGLKPNEWFDGKWLGRFRRWRYRAEMCSCPTHPDDADGLLTWINKGLGDD